MGSRMMDKEEFVNIITMFKFMPIKENESKNRYYKRLIESEAVKRSRTTLQLCESAVKDAPDNIDAAYEAYCKLSNDRQMKKQEAKAKRISVEAVCQQEDVAGQCDEKLEEKPEHDLAAAYRFLMNECNDVSIYGGTLKLTMEVSKWESLF